MIKYRFLSVVLLISIFFSPAMAEMKTVNDSILVNLKEVLIYRSLRENSFLGESPVSSTSLSGKKLDMQNADNLRCLAPYIANLYVPDYGSKITSAVYIRGIGSRINTSAVGFYVDNVPYLDKSAFDFEFQDIQRVDVLRGPQGTLYGRNSSGGIIHIHTNSPFANIGTNLRLSYGNYNSKKVQVRHAMLLDPNVALSVSANYNGSDGYVKNQFTGNNAGDWYSAGGRARLSARFNNGWRSDVNVSYDYSNQDGYAYAPYNENELVVSYNDSAFYKRHLLTSGLLIERQTSNTVLSLITGYQLLSDKLGLDQDFTPASLFTLNQDQLQHSVSQEVIFKSAGNRKWEWVNGASGIFKKLFTDSPVRFKADGVTMLEGSINGGIPASLNMKIDMTDQALVIPSDFVENNQTAAIYHQSTYNFDFIKGLSATVGLRFDYDQVYIDYASSAKVNYSYQMARGPMVVKDNLQAKALLEGKKYSDYSELVPKFALQYKLNNGTRVYASATKGFQAGGYNIQLFSDLVQSELQTEMSKQMKGSIKQQFQKYIAMGMPQSQIDVILSRIPEPENIKDIESLISYAPEYSWNYEVGFHSEPVTGMLQIDGAVFYSNIENRQITVFSPNGFGRMMKNAGASLSKGLELSFIAKPFKNFSLSASYGLTEAKFTEYKDSVVVNGEVLELDYKDKYVPMVPKHTLSVGADYKFDLNSKLIDKLTLSAQYNAAGEIYWTTSNNMKQDLYGLLDAQVVLQKEDLIFELWAKNALNSKYNTFYFESMGHSFAQQGRPMQLGATVRYSF